MNWQEALARAENLLQVATDETRRGGDLDRAPVLASIARGYIELAKVVKP